MASESWLDGVPNLVMGRLSFADFRVPALGHWGVAEPSDQGLRHEREVRYEGEKASFFSFFSMFPGIIFRKRGSVLPKILLETVIAVGLGVVAWGLTDDGFCDLASCGMFYIPPSSSRDKGHAMIGVLLAFLVVFRSQIAWSMYWEGRLHVGAILTNSRCLAQQLLASLAHASVEQVLKAVEGVNVLGMPQRGRTADRQKAADAEMDLQLAILALESVRLIKLFYWTVVEHTRSTDGGRAWNAAHEMVQNFATKAEYDEMLREFGPVQKGSRREKVLIPGSGDIEEGATDGLEKRRSITKLLSSYFKRGTSARTQDPTRSKPLVVLTWLRINIERMHRAKAIEQGQARIS